MIGDDEERAWWVYELPTPGCIVHVPAPTEELAREKLRCAQYKGAPVDAYPFIASRWASRNAIVRSVLGRPVLGQGSPEPGVEPKEKS